MNGCYWSAEPAVRRSSAPRKAFLHTLPERPTPVQMPSSNVVACILSLPGCDSRRRPNQVGLSGTEQTGLCLVEPRPRGSCCPDPETRSPADAPRLTNVLDMLTESDTASSICEASQHVARLCRSDILGLTDGESALRYNPWRERQRGVV